MTVRTITRHLLSAASAVSVAMMLFSCEEETVIERSGAARLNPRVTVDASIFDPASDEPVMLSGAPDATELAFSLSGSDGRFEHSWESVADYPLSELLRPGEYTAEAHFGNPLEEGFDCPYFYGERKISLLSGMDAEIEVTASLASSIFNAVFDNRLTERFTSVSATIHSEAFSYVDYPAGESRQVFIHPGVVSIMLNVDDAAHGTTSIEIARIGNAAGRYRYNIEFVSDGDPEPTVTALINGSECGSVRLTDRLLSSAAPEITTSGFESETPIDLTEGETPETPLIFNIADSPAKTLTLSTSATDLISQGWPAEVDLSNAPAPTIELMNRLGLRLSHDASGNITAVDLTEAMSRLRSVDTTTNASFTLMATNVAGKNSRPATLTVTVHPVDIGIVSLSNIIMGINKGELTILCHSGNPAANIAIEALSDRDWTECTIDSFEKRQNNEYAILFNVPETARTTQQVRILYCGRVISELTLERVAPDFTIEADPFALSALIRVRADAPSMTSLITSLLRIYVNGVRTDALNREEDKGLIHIGDLQPNRKYTVTVTPFENPEPADFNPTVCSFNTEQTLQIKNSSFEDRDENRTYKNIPSGGRYSQTIIDVYNCQNYSTLTFQVPRNWANTNAKTFCTAARNFNTWFVNPSVMSEVDNVEGYFAIKLQSVSWDIDGEKIADYRQKPGQFIRYNPNVPAIRHNAAGKLFLGQYTFDPATETETYTEGISFTSRPIALNGTYCFAPCTNDLYDTGLISIEILGELNGAEICLARNQANLTPALTYTAFSIPLTYDFFGVIATKIKIMLSSSKHCGSIEYETANIKTTPDPMTATATGGVLRVQDITLSYI